MINLKGKTVVPGLIEGHVHVVSLANRPGYHTVIEQATIIADIQALLAARRPDVPEGQFITAMGGWSTNFFAERRLPTLAELDAAVSDRPVFIYSGGGGPAVTNSLGKAFFESVSDAQAGPVVVSPTGAIATGNPNQANRALYHLRVRQTFEDKKRSAIDAMRYSASVGLTHTSTRSCRRRRPRSARRRVSRTSTTSACTTPGSPCTGTATRIVRLQMNFLHNQNDIALPELKQRLLNQFQLFGDDMLMTGGIGEWGAPGDGVGPVWLEAQRVIAQARWRNTNRTLSLATLEAIVTGLETVGAGVRLQRPALDRASRPGRDAGAARAAEGAERRRPVRRVALQQRHPDGGRLAVPDGAGERHPERDPHGRRPHRAAHAVVRPLLHDHRRQLAGRPDQRRPADLAGRRRCGCTRARTPGT